MEPSDSENKIQVISLKMTVGRWKRNTFRCVVVEEPESIERMVQGPTIATWFVRLKDLIKNRTSVCLNYLHKTHRANW